MPLARGTALLLQFTVDGGDVCLASPRLEPLNFSGSSGRQGRLSVLPSLIAVDGRRNAALNSPNSTTWPGHHVACPGRRVDASDAGGCLSTSRDRPPRCRRCWCRSGRAQPGKQIAVCATPLRKPTMVSPLLLPGPKCRSSMRSAPDPSVSRSCRCPEDCAFSRERRIFSILALVWRAPPPPPMPERSRAAE